MQTAEYEWTRSPADCAIWKDVEGISDVTEHFDCMQSMLDEGAFDDPQAAADLFKMCESDAMDTVVWGSAASGAWATYIDPEDVNRHFVTIARTAEKLGVQRKVRLCIENFGWAFHFWVQDKNKTLK